MPSGVVSDYIYRPPGESQTDQRMVALVTAANSVGIPYTAICVLRFTPGAKTGYVAWLGESGGPCLAMTPVSSGAATGIVTSPAFSAAAGTEYVIDFRAIGTTISATIATAADPSTIIQSISITDSSYASGVAGFTAFSGVPNAVSRATVYSVSSTSYTVAPTSVPAGAVAGTGAYTCLRLTGSGTNWTGTPFSISGGTNASLTNQVVIGTTDAALILDTGTAAGTITISDGDTTTAVTVTAPSTTEQIVFIGDSVTAGNGLSATQKWSYLVGTVLGPAWLPSVFAVSGATVLPSANTIPWSAAISAFDGTKAANWCTVSGGLNDILTGTSSVAATYAGLVTNCQALRAAGYKLIIFTLAQDSSSGVTIEDPYGLVDSYNALIRAFRLAYICGRVNRLRTRTAALDSTEASLTRCFSRTISRIRVRRRPCCSRKRSLRPCWIAITRAHFRAFIPHSWPEPTQSL